MAKSSKDAHGACGQSNLLYFEPEALYLVDDPAHPLYDERIYLPINEAMVRNIMVLGVIEPISVWKDPELGKTFVVEGRQRVRNSSEANRRLRELGRPLVRVPGVVKKGSASRMAEIMVSSNEITQPDTPLGRAKKMANMQERGRDEEDLALYFGCSASTVKATLALLDCTQVVQEAVEAGTVNVTQARKLAELPPDEQRTTVKELVQIGSESTGHARAKRQREVMGDVKPKIKTRKQIKQALDSATGDYAAALVWVLGEEK